MAALSLARAYQNSFRTHPNVTLALTGGTLNALGDFVAQVSQNVVSSSCLQTRKEHEPHRPYDYARTARFFFFGLTISPVMGRWNAYLEARFPLKRYRYTKKINLGALGKRVAADQLLMCVFVALQLCYFIGFMGVTENRPPSQVIEKFRDIYGTALITNWKVWPLAQLVNFRYMPLAYRVPFSQGCGVLWTLYLSVLNSQEEAKQERMAALKRRYS
ncbi:Protein sym1 [Leucoagaricus sp. SymC.cos]|nr:Protein sym1 [Leucoagaricus sp. SymC.cos]